MSWLGVFGAHAEDDFFLKGGETIVFFGDSITQGGLYVEYVDAFLATRFPDLQFRVINRGISSETISGTSEPDHDPRRPDAHSRFSRDIPTCKPDIVVACFGMNDGNYHPFDPERFERYQAGVRRLIDRTREEANARLVILTPPPFDPYRRGVGDPNAVHYGYKFPAVDYDDTLTRYSQWLLTLRNEGVVVADVHAATNEHLKRRREKKVSFYLAGDAVHPGPTGHWLMAQTLLEAWNAPAVAAECVIDAGALRAVTGAVRELKRDGGAISWTWRTSLPMPMDPQWDEESIALEKMKDRLNRYRLAVRGLRAARYRLTANGKAVADAARAEFEKGLDLLRYPEFPTVAASQEVLKRVQERQRMLYRAWRKSIAPARQGRKNEAGPSPAGAQARAAEIRTEIRDLCRPRDIELRLEPVGAATAGDAGGETPWQSLFNGRNLDGWTVQCRASDRSKEFWKVADGTILADSIGHKGHDYVWLATNEEYADFILRLRFQAYRDSPGNSGVQIRSRYDESDEGGWLNGPQIDINPPGPWRTGMIWDETRGNQRWLYPPVPRGEWVKESMAKPGLRFYYSDQGDGWNDLEISAIGMKLKALLNGVTVMEFDGDEVLNDAVHKARRVGEKGFIALQIHTGDQLRIRFKDIQIRDLPE